MRLLFRSLAFLFLITTVQQASAQTYENAGAYMSYISKANEKITSLYLSYLSAVGHNKSARKVDKRRQELVTALSNTRMDVMGMPPWKGDRSYRDSTVSYLKILLAVFNEDYARIVNMEEIAEQSYDAMEAYMLAQKKAGERLQEAADHRHQLFNEFAAKWSVTIVESTSELEEKNKQASALMEHYNKMFLIFFKPNKQEAYLIDAIAANNLTSFEQSRTALSRFADEGLQKLEGMTGYNNDGALIAAGKELMAFYKSEAERASYATDFLLLTESFEKTKKAFNALPASQRKQKDVNDYNKAVNEMNNGISAYNAANTKLNKDRSKALDNWNDVCRKYLDTYMPYQRKG